MQRRFTTFFFTLKKVLEVECPPGKVVGYVEQNLNCYRPTYDICGPDGDAQYVIEGPSSCKTWCRSWTGKGHHMVSKPVRKMGSITCAKNIGTSDFAQIVLGLNK